MAELVDARRREARDAETLLVAQRDSAPVLLQVRILSVQLNKLIMEFTKEIRDQIKWDLLHGEIDQLFDILDGFIFKSVYHKDLLKQIESRAENLRLEASTELHKLPEDDRPKAD